MSIKQPWAELILQRRKIIELRTWTTTKRGWMWLHTGKSPVPGGADYFRLDNLFCGGFVGAFYLKNVENLDRPRWTEFRHKHLDPGHFQDGIYAWTLTHAVRLVSPVPASGAMGLFSIDALLLQSLCLSKFVGEG